MGHRSFLEIEERNSSKETGKGCSAEGIEEHRISEAVVGLHRPRAAMGHRISEVPEVLRISKAVEEHCKVWVLVGLHKLKAAVGHHISEAVVEHHKPRAAEGHHKLKVAVGHHRLGATVGHHKLMAVVEHHMLEQLEVDRIERRSVVERKRLAAEQHRQSRRSHLQDHREFNP